MILKILLVIYKVDDQKQSILWTIVFASLLLLQFKSCNIFQLPLAHSVF